MDTRVLAHQNVRHNQTDVIVCDYQSVHQLLPPPYRVVWLEWLDEEKATADMVKQTENKVRAEHHFTRPRNHHITDSY